jgi:hypothetical protein
MPRRSDRKLALDSLSRTVQRLKKNALHREILDEEDSIQDEYDQYMYSLLKCKRSSRYFYHKSSYPFIVFLRGIYSLSKKIIEMIITCKKTSNLKTDNIIGFSIHKLGIVHIFRSSPSFLLNIKIRFSMKRPFFFQNGVPRVLSKHMFDPIQLNSYHM